MVRLTFLLLLWVPGAFLLFPAARANGCTRATAAAPVRPPADLFSRDGVLSVVFHYETSTDADGRTLYCFVTPDGLENPTLHVLPGDRLKIDLINDLPASAAAGLGMTMPSSTPVCGDTTMGPQSVNIHFHGMNVAPVCHGDEVIHTIVNPGQHFGYSIKVPADEPPGMYWYHPHIHGISHQALEGGASGAIEVEGIQSIVPAVANLPERLLIMRDQVVAPGASGKRRTPNLDLTLNTVPIAFPRELPATIETRPARREFWRFVNASADDIAVLQLNYDGVAQSLGLVARDGVPLGSQDKTFRPHIQYLQTLLVPPAGRAEFIVTTPALTVAHATLETLKPDNGPLGDSDPARTLARIIATAPPAASALPVMPVAEPEVRAPKRFAGLDDATVSKTRSLYFYEFNPDPGDPGDGLFYVVVKGRTPTLFDPKAPPAITTTQGAVEDWTIENRTGEVHEFHIHQIHFQLRAINDKPVPADQRQMMDTVQVPYWTGHGPYPSVTLRMDFRGQVVGDFVYHCHILDHEDLGMMAVIRVLPKASG